jgi:hypothetical protein
MEREADSPGRLLLSSLLLFPLLLVLLLRSILLFFLRFFPRRELVEPEVIVEIGEGVYDERDADGVVFYQRSSCSGGLGDGERLR